MLGSLLNDNKTDGLKVFHRYSIGEGHYFQ